METQAADNRSVLPTVLGRATKMIVLSTIALSVVSCFVIAAIRSEGLAKVTVTALDEAAEPVDHDLPLIKSVEALPDYSLIVNLTDGSQIKLGTRPNRSAIGGLAWQIANPVSIYDISSIRLEDEDTFLSDTIEEISLANDVVIAGNYRFEFETERSFAVGIASFFKTPIGIAITTAFSIAILIIILMLLASIFL